MSDCRVSPLSRSTSFRGVERNCGTSDPRMVEGDTTTAPDTQYEALVMYIVSISTWIKFYENVIENGIFFKAITSESGGTDISYDNGFEKKNSRKMKISGHLQPWNENTVVQGTWKNSRCTLKALSHLIWPKPKFLGGSIWVDPSCVGCHPQLQRWPICLILPGRKDQQW